MKLNDIAKEFERHTKLALPYHGDTLPSLMRRLVDEHLYYRRRKVPQEVIARLRARAKDLCEHCGDAVDEYEIHHTKEVCFGGENSIENLQLLCRPCHVSVTESRYIERKPRLQSCFTPEMAELFYNTPKPQQLCWGIGPGELTHILSSTLTVVAETLYTRTTRQPLPSQTSWSPTTNASRTTTSSGLITGSS
ncbi:MAG UNVERIFIED_CONTAM: HNH endonuclease [Anaerolineae bacterium]